MKSQITRFAELKVKIGGNREQTGFEYTHGLAMEKKAFITQPNAHIRRIISECEYAIKLSEASENQFGKEIDRALTILEDCMETEGVLTRTACETAEQELLPLQKAAKEYELILAAHAHIDMNWEWGWQETVATVIATFRTILHLMEEYPEFKYSQSQAAVYKIIEDYEPQLMEEIKRRIREGRWEVTATAWVETDKNMPTEESLLRHIQYTRNYMKEVWDVDPNSLEVDFSPDTFGHSAHVPEINSYGKVKYYYHCRGLNSSAVLYRWRSPSGKELLNYREQYWYSYGITPTIGMGIFDIAKRCNGFKTGLVVYGVGDHGGGPTRRDIEHAIEMQAWPIFPTIRFGTFREFFQKAEREKERFPIIDYELNPFATGCYTTQARLKLGNRCSEASLLDAEKWSALAHVSVGHKHPGKRLEKAWRNVLFAQFHDILTGACVQDTREHAMGLYADSLAHANSVNLNALQALCENIDTSMVEIDAYDKMESTTEGAGVGFGIAHYAGVPNPETGIGKTRLYTVFNPSPYERSGNALVSVWDWIHDFRRIELTDTDGTPLPFQLLDDNHVHYWGHRYFRVLVKVTVPATGFLTIVLREKEVTSYPTYFIGDNGTGGSHNPIILENNHIRACFSPSNGLLTSLIDKSTGKEQIRQGEAAAFAVEHGEAQTNSAWQAGRYLGRDLITDTISIHPRTGGKLRSSMTVKHRYKNSYITTTVSLDDDSRALAYEVQIDWNEFARGEENIPVLTYYIPLEQTVETLQFDVPAGYQRRPQKYMDQPGLQYGAAVFAEERALAVTCNCKYGYRGIENTLELTLINTAHDPDKYTDRGEHNIKFWISPENASPVELKKASTELLSLMLSVPTGSHIGKLAPKTSLFGMDSCSSIVSSIGITDDGALLVRVYELCGKKDCVVLTLPETVKGAMLVDLKETCIGVAEVNGKTVAFELDAYCVAGVKIHL